MRIYLSFVLLLKAKLQSGDKCANYQSLLYPITDKSARGHTHTHTNQLIKNSKWLNSSKLRMYCNYLSCPFHFMLLKCSVLCFKMLTSSSWSTGELNKVFSLSLCQNSHTEDCKTSYLPNQLAQAHRNSYHFDCQRGQQ